MPCNLGVLGLVLIAGCVSIVNSRRKTYIKFLRVVPFDTWLVSYSFVGPVGLGSTEEKAFMVSRKWGLGQWGSSLRVWTEPA